MRQLILLLLLFKIISADTNINNKNEYGTSVNHISLIHLTAREPDDDEEYWRFYSGSFSYFNYENKYELTIPYVYERIRKPSYEGGDDIYVKYFDIEYKRYFNDKLRFLYLGGLIRVGKMRRYLVDDTDIVDIIKDKEFVALGLSVGYRVTTSNLSFLGGAGLYTWVGVKGGYYI